MAVVYSAIGVNYGIIGDNLPLPKDSVALLQRSNIKLVRLFEPVREVLEALRGANIDVSIGIRNEHIANIARSQEAANSWVNEYIAPYINGIIFTHVTVGNEVEPAGLGDVALAMNNIWNALQPLGQTGIEITTVIPMTVLGNSFPPSAGVFTEQAVGPMTDITNFLVRTKGSLMINVYPYFAYASNPQQISLDYALFNLREPTVHDNGLEYYNLFDAMVDAFYAALEKINVNSVFLSVAETGWPTAGNEPYASIENARVYNTNLRQHLQDRIGTPRRPNVEMDLFYFALFNENLKSAGVEQNFGFFYPNMQPVYPFW
ncbi:hypothetical protein AQUCO_02300065v1 [Aquilegia coerulea]|uniref:Glucan endo-1,3-beta-D-glucosidase n=1 Tax=Aquilegia coerulea TaxID=218851 RepID=A0A2G5DBW8_AQUCA|nr:hypothetical protein AQUCO_02300065v1 [Aquilegia coerulea]